MKFRIHVKDGLGVHVDFVACDGKLMQKESAGINYTLGMISTVPGSVWFGSEP